MTEGISPKTKSRLNKLIWLIFVGAALFFFRTEILSASGSFLIHESELTRSDAIVVLGGNSLDRGQHAYSLYRQNFAGKIVCTGGNVPSVLSAIGEPLFESEVSRRLILAEGVDSSAVIALSSSTSTFEEAIELKDYAERNGLKSMIVVSSKFHTKRVSKVFDKAFKDSGITLLYSGAPSSSYDEAIWWKSESGMIMVNNEYMKLLYYFLKH